MLRNDQEQRYSRNILLPDLGTIGQEKLLSSKVLIIGVGGLGSPIAMYLGAAGVGTLGLVDNDVVDLSNLQRQIIYTQDSVGKSKVQEARDRVVATNSDIIVNVYNEIFHKDNGLDLLKDYDFIVDATDSIETKFLINDLCVTAGKPFCHGGVLEFVGQVMTVLPGKSSCYRCYFKKPPVGDAARKCSHGGILGAVAGAVGSIQATEALKYLTGIGNLLVDSLLIYEASSTMFRTLPVQRDTECAACSSHF